MNLNNLAPLLIAAVLFIALTAWMVWPSKPPDHDPDTCKECKWKQ